MKRTKKRQILALGLAAAMAVSNIGTAFAANYAGIPGKTEKSEEISVTLDAAGGKFTLTSPAGTKETVTVTAIASDSNAAEGGYYAKFGSFRLATDSNASIDFVGKGPDVKPEGKEDAEFGGWYEDLTNADTKLTSDSFIYSDITAYARWVEEVREISEALKEDIKEVQVSGLSDVKITQVNPYTESRIKDNIARLALNDDNGSYKVIGEAIVLDISAAQPDEPGMITMKIPASLKWKDGQTILVMHFQPYGSTELNENEGKQEAVIDKEKGTMTFTSGEFSPFAFVLAEKLDGQQPETVKVKVEDVPGGALIVYNLDENGNLSLLPIGKEVEVPFGTELQFRVDSMYLEDTQTMLEEDGNGNRVVRINMDGSTYEIEPYNTRFPVTGDAVISGTFWFQKRDTGSSSNPYWVNLRPSNWLDTDKPYEGTIRVWEYGEDGRSVEVEGIRAELDDSYTSYDNDKFTVTGNQIKSVDPLDIGTYHIALNIFAKDGTQFMGTDEDGNRLNYATCSVTVGVNRSFTAQMAQYMYKNGDEPQQARMSYPIGSLLLGKEEASDFTASRDAVFEEAGIKSVAMYGGHDLEYWMDYDGNRIDETKKLEDRASTFYAHFKDYVPVTVRALNGADLFLETADGSAYMKPEETKAIELKGKDAGKVTDVEWRVRYGDYFVELASEDGKKADIKATRVGTATIMAIVTAEGKDTTVVTQRIMVTESGEPEEPGQEIDLRIYGSSEMELGAEQTLSLIGRDTSNIREVTWKVEEPSVVRITETNDKTAKVSAAALGKTVVTATVTVATDTGNQVIDCTKSITVVEKGSLPGGDDKPGTEPGGDDKPGTEPGGDDKPGTEPGGDDKPASSGGGSGWVRPSNRSGSSSGSSASVGGWKRDSRGWRYLSSDGTILRGQWNKVADVWYYFGADGYMLTGWQLINGKWYYLTESEAGMGGMKTGWHYDDTYHAWFYFGQDGAMLTGWQLINDAWYYLNPGPEGTVGTMAADAHIGEYYVNANGVWVQ